MNKNTKLALGVAVVGVGAYLIWKQGQKTSSHVTDLSNPAYPNEPNDAEPKPIAFSGPVGNRKRLMSGRRNAVGGYARGSVGGGSVSGNVGTPFGDVSGSASIPVFSGDVGGSASMRNIVDNQTDVTRPSTFNANGTVGQGKGGKFFKVESSGWLRATGK